MMDLSLRVTTKHAAHILTLAVFAFAGPVLGEEDTWLCSTPQLANQDAYPFGDQFGELFFWDSKLELAINQNTTMSDDSRMDMLQVGFRGDAWLPEDGLGGSTADSIIVGVKFLDGSEDQRRSVLSSMSKWIDQDIEHPIKLQKVDSGYAQVRVSFYGANRSAIGRQALKIADQDSPTMQLMGVKGDNSVSELALVSHEFGHALGLRHEHQHPESGIKWDEEAVMDYFTARDWKKSDVRKNIFEALSFSYKCPGASEFDKQSIMIYLIKKEWTLDNYEVPAPEEIQSRDLRCVASLHE